MERTLNDNLYATGLLHLLKAEPSLLPPAPGRVTGRDLDMRRLVGGQACIQCDGRAETALVAETTLGLRWVDLCWTHYDAVKRASDD